MPVPAPFLVRLAKRKILTLPCSSGVLHVLVRAEGHESSRKQLEHDGVYLLRHYQTMVKGAAQDCPIVNRPGLDEAVADANPLA